MMGEMEQWKQGSKCCDRFSFIDSAKCRTDWDEVTVRDVGQENWWMMGEQQVCEGSSFMITFSFLSKDKHERWRITWEGHRCILHFKLKVKKISQSINKNNKCWVSFKVLNTTYTISDTKVKSDIWFIQPAGLASVISVCLHHAKFTTNNSIWESRIL